MYKPIIGVLAYLLSKDKKKVLLIHRNKKKGDDHLGKYNGLGGKMEPNETALGTLKREIKEEAGVEAKEILYKGMINWRGFGSREEDWIGFIYRIDHYEGEVKQTCLEGDLEWVSINRLETVPMWEGDNLFLPYIFDDTKKEFNAFIEYKGERVVNHHFSW